MDIGPEIVLLHGGTFRMGKDGSRADESPAHVVTVDAFAVAISPVTNLEYDRYVAATGKAPSPFLAEARFAGPGQPVVGINWFEALGYCDWLSSEIGLHYRLPTEAEREFAARGGLNGDWPWDSDNAEFVAALNAFDAPHEPEPRCANNYGLRCMAENVHEWCSDWYSPGYYALSPAANPTGPASGNRRVARGGAWRHKDKVTRVNARSSLDPTFHYSDFGFRVYGDA